MNQPELMRSYYKLRSFYESHFEHSWFHMLMEDIPVDPTLLKDIRDFLRIREDWQLDEARARKGVTDLEAFLLTLRQWLLPAIRERLRISFLKPDTVIRDRDQLAIRNLIAQAIPLNIESLEAMTKEMDAALKDEKAAVIAAAS